MEDRVPSRIVAPATLVSPVEEGAPGRSIRPSVSAADKPRVAAGISRQEVVVSAGVSQAAEDVLARYAGGPWTLVVSEYLGLGSDRWGAIFRADDESEVVLAWARPTAREAVTTTVTEVRIDVATYAGGLTHADASP